MTNFVNSRILVIVLDLNLDLIALSMTPDSNIVLGRIFEEEKNRKRLFVGSRMSIYTFIYVITYV